MLQAAHLDSLPAMPLPLVVLASALLSGALAAATATAATAAEPRVWLQVGVLQADIDSGFRLDYTGAAEFGLPTIGTTLDFERHLGMASRQSVPFALLGVRLWDRWRLELEGYRLKRSATRVLIDEAFVIGGVTYEGSVRLHSRFDSEVLRASVGYSFLKTPVVEAGVALGVQQTRYTLSITGEGRATDLPTALRTVTEEDDGPLPTVGLFGSVEMGSAWQAATRLNYLPVKNRHGTGRLVNIELDVSMRLGPNWRVGGGYRAVRYQIDDDGSSDLSARFSYRFSGPQIYVQAGF